ncbi:hypothetical protein E1295_14795 [Nonomuraea mesophila]|uniref:Uncharacterized protein n=1 Tax=Nonomuraea mesophila TaxID=2530382 RepID=A0A4R5FPK5_9ACTN|nr:hypothetical protein [Nonomuraea mesophila]TDE54656.1 hypothetical protein E1295_14795 [Nonomuraea mesophila]
MAAACLAAGALAGNTSTTAYLDLPTMAAHSGKAVKKSAKAASFTLAYVRVAGASRINQKGVTCYTGPVSFGVGLEATKMGARFSYRWLVDGKVVEKGSRSLPSYSRSDYFGSKKQVTMDLGTSHKVVFQLTSPGRRSKSSSWVMC